MVTHDLDIHFRIAVLICHSSGWIMFITVKRTMLRLGIHNVRHSSFYFQ